MDDLRSMKVSIEVNAGDSKREIEGINQKLDDTKEKAQKAVKEASSLGTRIQNSFKNANSSIGSLDFNKAGKSMQSLGAKMTIATAPLTLGIKKSIDAVRDLGYGIAKVNTLNDQSILPTEQLQKDIRKISDMVGISQEEIAEGYYQALSSGVQSKDVSNFVSSNVKLAKAGFTDMTTAIDATTTVLNAYRDKAYDVTKIHDILVKTQDKGKITVDELGHSLGQIIPTAATAGVNLDQLGAAYAILTSAGQPAERATTNINTMLQELSTTGTNADKAVRESTGKTFKQLMEDGKDLEFVLGKINDVAQKSGLELADIFGSVTAKKAVNQLFGSDFKTMRDIMNNAGGSAEKNFEGIMDTDQAKYERTMTKLKNTGMDIAENLMPFIDRFATRVEELMEKFNQLSPDKQKLFADAIGTLVISGPAIAAAGTGFQLIGGVVQGGKFISGLFTGKKALEGTAAAAKAIEAAGAAEKISAAGGAIESAGASAGIAAGGLSTLLGALGAIGAIGGVAYAGKILWDKGKRIKKDPSNWKNILLNNPDEARERYRQQTMNYIAKLDAKKRAKGHKTGLTEVPYDDYYARLHKGERVLTAGEAKEYNQTKSETTTTNVNPTINITINAQKTDADDIAAKCEREINKYFRNLRLQRI
jgi:TP901 family phage tail tape measure protein